MPLNVEIKARCSNPDNIRQLLQNLNAEFVGRDDQTDTYFKMKNGRLKLRQGNIENSLIFYNRTDIPGPKKSEVLLFPIKDGGKDLESLLSAALEVHVVVKKSRQIFYLENVKFHIDAVLGLGNFVEIEAIDRNGTIGLEKLNDQCKYYMKHFEIKNADLVQCSYSDLLLSEKRI